MSAADFPPRPWRVDYAQGIIDADETPIAYMMGPESSTTPHPVAALFAAAPDLLDALKSLRETVGVLRVEATKIAEVMACLYMADDAIDKAEGGAS